MKNSCNPFPAVIQWKPKGGETMAENNLKHIEGKKIRRQYFNIPIVILYSLALAIPYAIFIFSLCLGKLDAYEWPSTLWTSIGVCFAFSLPFLLLRVLNKHFFGRILCVLTEEGLYYANGGKLRWETIEKIEYAIDTKPRYKSDSKAAFRAIVYTQGGRRIVLEKCPLYIVSCIKKYNKELDVRIAGATSLIPTVLIVASIVLICPFYVVLLRNAPGASTVQFVVLFAIALVIGVIRIPVFDAYCIQYRFWSKLLPKKTLSHIALGCYYSSFFAVLLILSYFPNWVVVALLGIYMGVAQPPIPSRHGIRNRDLPSYQRLYNIYVDNAAFWEKKIEKSKQKRNKKKDTRTVE